MYALDNNSGVSVMPTLKSKVFNHNEPRWFTEGGNGVAPSYPGADWFNIVQAELLNVLQDGAIQPDKTQLNQITTAIRRIVANAVSDGLSGKANTSHSHTWNDITNKPSTFSPASHTHTMANITDFELKQLSTEDLDTVKKAGMYGQVASANATTARHYPETQAGALLVMPSAYGWMQIYIAHSTYRIYIRNINNSGGWASWFRMDGRDKLNNSDFTNFKNLLVGIPFPYPLSAVPSGCLAFNGQAFNKATYPELAKKYTSGKLPDLRGEFIRGWDNGRGVDSGRGLLSGQGDAIRNIIGSVSTDNGWFFTTLNGVFYDGNPEYTNLNKQITRAMVTGSTLTTDSFRKGYFSLDASRAVPTANENRPRNIAFQYICLAA